MKKMLIALAATAVLGMGAAMAHSSAYNDGAQTMQKIAASTKTTERKRIAIVAMWTDTTPSTNNMDGCA